MIAERLALLALCAAYIQSGLNKLLDFPGAVAEATHFSLPVPTATATLTIALELIASAMVVSGRRRAWGALALAAFTLAASLIANRFWELPAGQERLMLANGFFEHIGLSGGFVLVALWSRRRG